MLKNYKKTGFEYISGPMGSTGHVSCPVLDAEEVLKS
jgi:putative acetyltransferase